MPDNLNSDSALRKFSYVLAGLVAIGSLISVYLEEFRWLSRVGLPLDDSYIHLQYARNIIRGHFFVYHIGDKPTAGDTSPLFVLLIALFGLFYKNLIIVGLFLSGVFYLLSCLFAFKLADVFFKNNWLKISFPLVLAMTGRFLWSGVSGMEVTLFSFLCILGLIIYFKGNSEARFPAILGLIFGLAGNARPEGHLVFIFLLFDWLLIRMILRKKRLSLKAVPFSAVFIYLALALPYPVFCYIISGHFTPSSFLALTGGFSFNESFNYLKAIHKGISKDNILLYVSFFAGMALFLANVIRGEGREREHFLIWLIPVGYIVVSFFVAPVPINMLRYLIPFLPFYILLSLYCLEWVIKLLPKRWLRFAYTAIAVMITLYSGLRCFPSWLKISALSVKNIEDMQVRIGYWVRDNTPKDALIGANDIGAIFYISERPVLDVIGLVNPELLEGVKKAGPNDSYEKIVFSELHKKRADYLIIFPDWFPALSSLRYFFEEVYSVELKDNIICGANKMVVYKCDWW